jgi:hypothetical protein
MSFVYTSYCHKNVFLSVLKCPEPVSSLTIISDKFPETIKIPKTVKAASSVHYELNEKDCFTLKRKA